MEGVGGLWGSLGVKRPLKTEVLSMTLPLGGITRHLSPHNPVVPNFPMLINVMGCDGAAHYDD